MYTIQEIFYNKEYLKCTRKNIYNDCKEWLEQSLEENEFKESAGLKLFKEALKRSKETRELRKIFLYYCNEELGKEFVREDVVINEIKSFITTVKF